MHYFVSIEGRTIEVVIEGETVTLDGQRVDVSIAQVPGTPVRHVLVDGKSQRVVAQANGERGVWDVHMLGRRLSAEVVDERTRAIRALTNQNAGPTGPKPIKAPMPGMIVRVDVAPGDKVKAGQGVVIIEAMKMENELKAEAAGVVAKVLAQPGSPVEKGAVLVEFAAHE